jgi:mono/diheme cytochrome c family protein
VRAHVRAASDRPAVAPVARTSVHSLRVRAASDRPAVAPVARTSVHSLRARASVDRPAVARIARASVRKTGLGLVFALVVFATAGCRQDMHDQPRVKPLAASEFYADGAASRLPPAGTVARGQFRTDRELATGRHPDDMLLASLPAAEERRFERDRRAYLLRGRERYEIFCAPCHGRTGAGDGMVVRRGYKQPSSYHVDRLRMAPLGYFFDVVTNGFGVMPSYAAQVPVEDRWAIAAYVRTLQLSQQFDAAKLATTERALLEAQRAAAAAAAPGAH